MINNTQELQLVTMVPEYENFPFDRKNLNEIAQ